ncbi:hypothetical protein H6P81_018907 [Aristolochia fimbriata]|uniref:Cytochrome P450 n=1 Tax=Aristolochia fimbriata TaxID=158543 RepID=A0AAV7E396_ARIFI|nr:hypothetical protein H6P81_018907 [Aristolochia fimbriata]
MDLQLPSSLLLCQLLPLFCFIVVILKMIKKGYSGSSKPPKLPPGPWQLPVIGSIHHMNSKSGQTLPHHTLRDLAKKYGPLMHLQMGEVPLVVASTAEAAKEIMKTHDLNFATRPEMPTIKYISYGYTDIVFAPYGAYWRQMRKICMLELLALKRVESFRFIREEEVLRMLHYINDVSCSTNSPVNLTRMFYSLTNNIAARAAFGFRSKYIDMFLSAIKDATRAASGFSVVDLFPSSKLLLWITGMKDKLEKNHKELDHIISDILAECRHRNNSKKRSETANIGVREVDENFIETFLRLQQHGNLEVPITDNNIKAVVLDMFTAGTDTSATVLGWTMSELMRNPVILMKAQKEVRDVVGVKEKVSEADIQHLEYLKLIVKETLRLHPPVPLLLPRENREKKCLVMGYELPTYTKVIVNVWALGRDPLYWGDDAEIFRPERFADKYYSVDYKGTNFEFLPFGAGRRMCPGVAFGMASVELPLALLLYHFNWELPHGMEPEDVDMTEDFGASAARKSELYLVPKLYNPLPGM